MKMEYAIGAPQSTRSKTAAKSRLDRVTGLSQSSSSFPWASLPTEMKRMIYKLIEEPMNTQTRRRNYANSKYAIVSSEWRNFFEPVNFRRLVLHQNDVSKCDEILQGHRREYLQWIWLRVKLPRYECDDCRLNEGADILRYHNAVLTRALHGILTTLSSWKDDEVCSEGLTFEISAHSPSDADHHFKELQSRINDTAENKVARYLKIDSEDHGWIDDKRSRPAKRKELNRVFGMGDDGKYGGLRLDLRVIPRPKVKGSARSSANQDPSWWPGSVSHNKKMKNLALLQKLPRVSVIKTFCLRRQFYRCFSMMKTMVPLIESLTHLREFRYEPLRKAETEFEFHRSFDRHFGQQHLVQYVLSTKKNTLKKVCLLDDCYRDEEDWLNTSDALSIDLASAERYIAGIFDLVKERRYLGVCLNSMSMTLEELHCSPTIDAKDFFSTISPKDGGVSADSAVRNVDEWTNLRYISLTAYPQGRVELSQLIQSAGRAALRMPQLQVMEIWNSIQGQAFVFRYERNHATRSPKLVLRTTGRAYLDKRAKEIWTKVAGGHHQVFHEMKWEESIAWQTGAQVSFKKWDVVKMLALKDRMLNQTTLKQMEFEAQGY